MNRYAQIALNVVIFLLVAGFVWYMVASLNKEESAHPDVVKDEGQPFTTPYRLIATVALPGKAVGLELYDNRLFLVSGEMVYIYNVEGEIQSHFPVGVDVRDITVADQQVYVLYPMRIEVYSMAGALTHSWEACSELSDYCSITLAAGHVFVTDAANKNICQYTVEGNFVRFIQSPREFIIPSYSFDIDHRNDTIYCVNAGRHLIETYTADGRFIAAFGGPGGEAGFFAGCCNPSHISFMPDGELITSEKGNPRISLFEQNGTFGRVLLNSKLLGGGNEAYGVVADGNKLYVTGKNTLKIFQL